MPQTPVHRVGREALKGTIISVSLPNGSTISIQSGVGSPITVSAATNANPCVVTATAHGLSDGDLVIFTSGWSRLTNRIFRVASSDTNSFALEDIDTSDTSKYPAGSGTGSVKEVTGWTQIQQVLSTATEGGEQNYATFQFLEDDFEQRIPTNKTAAGFNLTVADDPTLAGYIAAVAANEDGNPRAVRVLNKNGASTLFYSYVAVNVVPSMDVNTPQSVQMSFSHLNRPVRYAD